MGISSIVCLHKDTEIDDVAAFIKEHLSSDYTKFYYNKYEQDRARVSFRYKGIEDRYLTIGIFPSDTALYEVPEEYSLISSIGCWGNSHMIVQDIAEQFGGYYLVNDSSETDVAILTLDKKGHAVISDDTKLYIKIQKIVSKQETDVIFKHWNDISRIVKDQNNIGPNLHGKIMNLQKGEINAIDLFNKVQETINTVSFLNGYEEKNIIVDILYDIAEFGYNLGHKDARHAAAELVAGLDNV